MKLPEPLQLARTRREGSWLILYIAVPRSADPALSPDAARWTPEDD